MAFCTNCGNEFSESRDSCPHCGHPMGAQALPLQYADFWSRFAAALIDALILFIPSLLLGLRFRFLGGVIVEFFYHWLMIAYWDGQTIGKRALGIRILRPDGSPVDVAVAAARAGMRIVSGIPLLLGFVWAAWDPQRRTWHDAVADTRAYRV